MNTHVGFKNFIGNRPWPIYLVIDDRTSDTVVLAQLDKNQNRVGELMRIPKTVYTEDMIAVAKESKCDL